MPFAIGLAQELFRVYIFNFPNLTINRSDNSKQPPCIEKPSLVQPNIILIPPCKIGKRVRPSYLWKSTALLLVIYENIIFSDLHQYQISIILKYYLPKPNYFSLQPVLLRTITKNLKINSDYLEKNIRNKSRSTTNQQGLSNRNEYHNMQTLQWA